jgi:hypothetical protein
MLSSYSISGGGSASALASQGSLISYGGSGNTCTVSGTPTFTEFATAISGAIISVNTGSIAFSGSANGQRYNASVSGIITTNGGGANFFPGSTAGASPSGYHV